jgi:uncharacterized protein (DUF433 family)
MSKDYVSLIDGAYRITGTRVSLDSVVYAWMGGISPESIVDSYAVLTLEQVHGALAFSLANQEGVDNYLRQVEAEFDDLSQKLSHQLQQTNPLLYQKLIAHKQQKLTPSS